MTALSVSDAFFLWMEGRRSPMHVAGLYLYSLPEGAGPDFARDLASAASGWRHAEAPFNRYPVRQWGQWRWQDDRDFDIDHHFRRSALPHPGRVRELLELVSRLHGALQDRRRPPWEMHVIEGLADGRWATYLKLHHCLIDGVGSMRKAIAAHSTDPAERGMPPFWALTTKTQTQVTQTRSDPLDDLQAAWTEGRESAVGVRRALWDILRRSGIDPADVTPFQAPPSLLNPKITGTRRFAAQSWSLARFKALARKAGVKLNDIVLTICSGALREYLLSRHALPDKPLVAMVPMSVRKTGSSSDGNQVAMLLVELATDEADPVARLQRIAASSRLSKERMSRMSPSEQFGYTLAAGLPLPLSVATRSYTLRPPFNVVISNVPGPEQTLYWNGARLDQLYPVSIIYDGQALNITLASYGDQLGFGFLGCRSTLPQLQRLLDHTQAALGELEARL
ncbi:MAG: WS/DGAT/MGAT family O-acyltransferase [Panacagrimonas sp.]